MQTVLVTGGTGYVGSHACLALAEAGFGPVVFDDLSNGHREHVQWEPWEEGDIRDGACLDAVFSAHKPVAVLHFAARIEVGESVKNPGAFFDNNVGGAITLIEAARRAGVNARVFSSTCATFGDSVNLPMAETHPQAPLKPYGRSKLMVEQALADYDRYVGLRHRVASGADRAGPLISARSPSSQNYPIVTFAV